MSESDWSGATEEKKFRLDGDIFIKSSLREEEWQCHHETGEKYQPKMSIERAKNEAANLRFIREHTSIPVPRVLYECENHGAYTIAMTRAKGVTMDTLSPPEKVIVMAKMQPYFDSFHRLKSSKLGGVSGLICPPHPVLNKVPYEKCQWAPKSILSDLYVFCHMDAHQENIFVDPETLDITCIIDFEFAGFYPQDFDLPLYKYERSQLPDRSDFAEEFLQFLNTYW
ncbi:kinase-like protein [Zopfia rhizophila CBS 207.26]|uniref:Kinase-like protein n=1 Tax=Zopfia rhizophila CBS 207.26 TaxID=1314779 RepID=A0A6A6ES98_9PEZI|nr:kinase-like protein [Zopfia rhizophila CBS 207.26]